MDELDIGEYSASANHGTNPMTGRATASQSDTSLGTTVIEFLSNTTISVMGCLTIPATFQWDEYNQMLGGGVEK